MKFFFLASSFWILYLMRVRFRASYDATGDSTNVFYLIIPCVALTVAYQLGVVGMEEFSVQDFFWVFSEFLEAVAILPQLWMLQKTGASETLTVHYLAALGGYRVFYVINWVYRYYVEGRKNWISWIAGGVQTLLYTDFFYHYFRIIFQRRETII
jgi:ER lumen protein retaining receptor